ncbi:hypothetical protein Rhal01_01030 [Rubritalea halochordaticola]|uniref:DUF559 domain-containing protein n=1 Tax=Rubritalea halochordaticola TaxID=714537 RepID=A0ABP9UWM0_9BACT
MLMEKRGYRLREYTSIVTQPIENLINLLYDNILLTEQLNECQVLAS